MKRVWAGFWVVPVLLMMAVIGCDQEQASSPTFSEVGLNFQQAGDPPDVSSDVCQKGYGIHLIHGNAEKGTPGQITLRLPVGSFTILYDTEGLGGNSKEVVVTSRKDWRVFIGTLAEHNRILNVMIVNNETGEMIAAVLDGVIQENAVCALADEFGQLPQPDPTPTTTPITCPAGSTLYAGQCWVYGAGGVSCDDACASVGRVCDTTVMAQISTTWTATDCENALTAVATLLDPVNVGNWGTALGCVNYMLAINSVLEQPASCGALDPRISRVCPCQ